VRECQEGAVAVVGAHARGAHAAEGQLVVSQVHQHVVEAERARGSARAHLQEGKARGQS